MLVDRCEGLYKWSKYVDRKWQYVEYKIYIYQLEKRDFAGITKKNDKYPLKYY